MDSCHINRLESTSEAIYDYFRRKRKTSYKCYQYGPVSGGTEDPRLQLLKQEDLDAAIATHGEETYIRQLWERRRLYGYYVEGHLVGYIAYHIDGSFGAVYVFPAYRRQGYAGKMISAVAFVCNDALMYSQVLVDNTASIRLHESMQLPCSGKIIHWTYDEGFCYKD